MTAETLRAIEAGDVWLDLSTRAKWRITGADRVRYLNGQVTNDVRRAAEHAIYACVTNARGRIEGDLFIHAEPGEISILVDTEPDLREALGARLGKYIVADDVELEDVTDRWRLAHRLDASGGGRPGIPRGLGHVVPCSRFGPPGFDFWLPVDASLPGPAAPPGDIDCYRILRGLPRWPAELSAGVFPQEAGLEARAMDYAKGCYVGQEMLSRIKRSGKLPRHLIRFSAPRPDTAVALSDPAAWLGAHPVRLLAGAGAAAQEAGAVTSLCLHPELDRIVGLGYVRPGFEPGQSLLLAVEGPPSIRLQADPLPP